MNKSKNLAIVSHNVLRKGSGQGRINYELIKYLVCRGVLQYAPTQIQIDVYAEHIEDNLLENVNFHRMKVPQKIGIVRMVAFIIIASLKLLFKKYDILQIDSGCTFAPYDVSICHICHASCIRYEKSFYHRYNRPRRVIFNRTIIVQGL